MSGLNELENDKIPDIVNKIDKALDEYEGRIGLSKPAMVSEAEKFLSYSHKDIQKMSDEDCGEAAIILAEFGFSIQRNYNAEMARINWAEEEVRRTVADKTNQYSGSSYEERKLQAIKHDDYASKVDKIRAWAKCRSERLAYIASKVEFLARTFMELQQTKRRQYGRNN